MTVSNVYIVEDDPVIAGAVADHLATWQMQSRCAKDFEHILEEVEEYQPDIILLDIKLPYYNGFYWCMAVSYTHLADVSLQRIAVIVNSFVKMDDAAAFLVDTNDGTILAHRDSSLVSTKLDTCLLYTSK